MSCRDDYELYWISEMHLLTRNSYIDGHHEDVLVDIYLAIIF